MTWGAIGAAGIGAGAGMIASKQKGGGGGTRPYQFLAYPEHAETRGRDRLMSDFVSSNVQRLSEGKTPAYYDAAVPGLSKAYKKGISENYFGGPGLRGPGIIDYQKGSGAAMGTGPSATLARENKALYDYSNKLSDVDQYFAQLGVDIAREGSYKFPQLSTMLSRGPAGQVVGGQSYQNPNYGGDAMNSIMSSLGGMDLEDMLDQSFDWLGDNIGGPTAGGAAFDYFGEGMQIPESWGVDDWGNYGTGGAQGGAFDYFNSANQAEPDYYKNQYSSDISRYGQGQQYGQGYQNFGKGLQDFYSQVPEQIWQRGVRDPYDFYTGLIS